MDAELPYPAIFVFPSWEKTLEDRDEQTQQAISQMIAEVLSHCLGGTFQSLSEVEDFAARKPEQFLTAVDQSRLFVAPGGPVDERLLDALSRYQREMETWRSQEWLNWYGTLPTHMRVLNAVLERLPPQYHLLANSEEMRGNPLLCLEQQAHYFKLVSATNSARLERLGLLNPHTRALVDAFRSHRLHWLAHIPSDQLARLRKDNENVAFRKRLGDALGRLHDSMLCNVDKVAEEICHELQSMIADHKKELRNLQDKYKRMHRLTSAISLAAAGVAFMPALAPFLGSVVPFALAARYGNDKVRELADRRALTQSLVGVLATASSKDS